MVTFEKQTELNLIKNIVNTLEESVMDLSSIRPDVYQLKSANWEEELKDIKKELFGEQMLLFIGGFSSGKSTFINALLGSAVLPTAENPCTAIITEVNLVDDNGGHRGTIHYKDGRKEGGRYADLAKILDGNNHMVGKYAAIHHIELFYDLCCADDNNSEDNECLRTLKNMGIKIIDTPGYESKWGLDEDVLDEYITRASHTFWFSPADRLGGEYAYRKLSKIKRKATTVIPVITMSDKVDVSEHEKIKLDFDDHLGELFSHREPCFISAIKMIEAVKIMREVNEKGITGSSKEKALTDARLLAEESRVESIAYAIINAGDQKQVINSKVKLAVMRLTDFCSTMKKSADQENAYWKKELNKLGWSPTVESEELDRKRKKLEKYIDNESKRVGSQFESMLTDGFHSYILTNRNKIEPRDIEQLIQKIRKDTIDPNYDRWEEGIKKIFDKNDIDVSIDKNETEFNAPNTNGLSLEISSLVMGMFDGVKYAGITSISCGSVGAALVASSATISALGWGVGPLLGPVALFAGWGLVGFAFIPLIPAIANSYKNFKEDEKKKQRSQLERWVKDLHMVDMLKKVLTTSTEHIYPNLLAKNNEALKIPLQNESSTKKISEDIDEARSKIDGLPTEVKR